MDVREKLVELLLKEDDVCKPNECKDCGANGSCYYHRAANRIIAHGVTVQKHGRWLLDGRCSECLENPLTTHKTYCPSCGAKMDLER